MTPQFSNLSEMLDIYFKNVGNGDCIILEQRTDTAVELGIIDCGVHRAFSINRAIEQLESYGQNIKIHIRFIILTHPHTDHFGGLVKLLEHCIAKGIKVDEFLHTAAFHRDVIGVEIKFDPLDASVRGQGNRDRLTDLFEKVKFLHHSRILEAGLFLERKEISFGQVRLKALAPNFHDEIASYLKNAIDFLPEEPETLIAKSINNAHANLLSTVILVSSDHWDLILTSDASIQALDRIAHSISSGKKLLVAQIPHHGSKHNHCENFWERLPLKGLPVVISCGGHLHPNSDVVTYFSGKESVIHATNQSGCFIVQSDTDVADDIADQILYASIHDVTGRLDNISLPIFGETKFSIDNEGNVIK